MKMEPWSHPKKMAVSAITLAVVKTKTDDKHAGHSFVTLNMRLPKWKMLQERRSQIGVRSSAQTSCNSIRPYLLLSSRNAGRHFNSRQSPTRLGFDIGGRHAYTPQQFSSGQYSDHGRVVGA